jgi:hypothetical protein
MRANLSVFDSLQATQNANVACSPIVNMGVEDEIQRSNAKLAKAQSDLMAFQNLLSQCKTPADDCIIQFCNKNIAEYKNEIDHLEKRINELKANKTGSIYEEAFYPKDHPVGTIQPPAKPAPKVQNFPHSTNEAADATDE